MQEPIIIAYYGHRIWNHHRWLETLSNYSFIVEHRPGRSHQNANGLSRLPIPEDTMIATNAANQIVTVKQITPVDNNNDAQTGCSFILDTAELKEAQ